MATKKDFFSRDSKVHWNWLGREISGHVQEIYSEPVIKEIKGKKIKRNGSVTNPAYLVQSEAGNLALKLHSELQPGREENSPVSWPTMFRKKPLK